ncbi:MAG: pantoate--beta-alanine ligase [Spirochaetaceae bacterium]|nr:pantoate--beta-alanine ligase [Spirochaetaceae bacterium]MBQ8560280.1 pantoate--beta-alanine ligase [Spirochaetaceae bacterium]
MDITTTIAQTRKYIKEWRSQGLTIGLVPTMGYLHDGHASLIRQARESCQKVVVSIFVNPMQFGANEDLSTYPRDLEADSRLCERLGVDVIFHPEPEEMYAPGFCSFVDMDGLTKELCGRSRPIHFRGVCTVVSKLFNIVTPNKAFFGQKDAQQLAVIRRMVTDLNMDIEIVGCPIVREEDGLARSSRNVYLSPEERQAALVLSKTIALGQRMVQEGVRDSGKLVQTMKEAIAQEPLARIDYVEAVSMDTIQPVETIQGRVLVAMAVFIGKTRLIDNFIVEV